MSAHHDASRPVTAPPPGERDDQPSATLRRLVVVGLGSIGRRHVRLLRERADVRVEVCEIGADALALAERELGPLTRHADLASALATQPDVVLIATPHELHATQAIAAMHAGVDVFCEKPLCLDPAEARAMLTAAHETGRHLGVGFQLHFQTAVRRMRELVNEGAIGRVVHAHARVGSFITLRNSVSRYQAALPGALLLDYAHQPDLMLWLLPGLPTAVSMTAVQAGALPLTSDPNLLSLTLEYGGTALATIHLNYVQMPQRHEWELVGEDGWIVLDVDRGELRLGRRSTEDEVRELLFTERDDMYRREHQAFIAALDGRREFESPAESAMRSVELFAFAMQSWREGRRVECQWQRLPARIPLCRV